jgi:hypothetical protein
MSHGIQPTSLKDLPAGLSRFLYENRPMDRTKVIWGDETNP